MSTLIDPRSTWFVLELSSSTGKYEEVAQCLQCRHCQMMWEVQPGSGKQRGWCGNCAGPTCGKQECETRCRPFEMRIEAMEGRLTLASQLHRIRHL